MQTLSDAQFLLTDEAQAAATEVAVRLGNEKQILAEQSELRKRFTANKASALITLVRLRKHAEGRFPNAEQLFFTRESLEQATAWEIADYRAAWLHEHAPPGHFYDLGCGIGGDLLHLARYRPVIAYETDPIRACFALANAKVMGLAENVQIRQVDWRVDLVGQHLSVASAAFIDPARRINGRRIFDVEKMIPPLSTITALQPQIPALCIKMMPGIQDRDIPANSQVKFISHKGTCKEAMLWLDGEKKSSDLSEPYPTKRSAAVYTNKEWHEISASQRTPPLGPIENGFYLHEPDPALIRAGAFWELCQQFDGWLFDPQIAYLVTCKSVTHALVQSFHLLEIHPFNLKKLNQRISVLNIGSVELKKRGMPFEPESLRKKLKLVPNGRPGVILFTRRGSERLMLIAERI